MVKHIDPLSCASVFIEPCFNDTVLSSATGFILKYKTSKFIITNWHVVTGKDAETKECLDKNNLAIPNNIRVYFHEKNNLGKWIAKKIELIDSNDNELWLSHPLKNKVDVVAIPLQEYDDINLYSLDFTLKDVDMIPIIGMPISVIGFPLGLTAGERWPIWKTGHIASDHDIDFEPNRPAFLIDATTRNGMSGSPVVLRADSYQSSNGYHLAAGVQTRFLGIYAGRIHAHAEIGRVWRPFLIEEVIERKLIFSLESGRTMPMRTDECPCQSGQKFKFCCGKIT